MITVPTIRLPDARLPLQAMLVTGALLSVAAVTGALLWQPALALLPLAALIAGLLLINAPSRTVFLVFGGMAVLQSSQELDATKLAYFTGVGFGGAGALFNVWQLRSTANARLLRPLIVLSLLSGTLLALTAIVSLAHGTPATAWLRDVSPYFLLAAVPVFALDLQSSMPRKLLVAMFVIAGLLASLSYSVEWLDRRNLADLPISSIVLPSAGLLSGLYLLAISGALIKNKNGVWWTALAALILSLVWITGSRGDSLVLLLVTPIVGVFAARQEGSPIGPALRFVLVGFVAVLFTLALTQSLARVSDYDIGNLTGRFESIVDASTGDDGSYREREAQTRVAWQTFVSNPVLGTGPGHRFEWDTVGGKLTANFNIDTGLSFPAKFGAAGVLILLALVITFILFLRNAGRGSRLTMPQVALVGFVALEFLNLPLSMPIEDKGFSFGLIFLLALSLPKDRELPKLNRTPAVSVGDR